MLENRRETQSGCRQDRNRNFLWYDLMPHFLQPVTFATWSVALTGSLLMVLFGVVDQKAALRDIPWDMLMLFVGALALGTALTNTGAGDMIGNTLASAVVEHITIMFLAHCFS